MSDSGTKTIVITGASAGIGAQAAIVLAGMGYDVIPVGRSESKLNGVADQMRAAGQESVIPVVADLANMDEVRGLAKILSAVTSRIDVLINNAGVIEKTKVITPDGFERTWAINHLAPFLLTTLLKDKLEASHPVRVITTSSFASNAGVIKEGQFNGDKFGTAFQTYAATKLANALFSVELARRWEGSGNTSNHVHPGSVKSEWGRDTWWLRAARPISDRFSLTPLQGAKPLIHLASSDEGGTANGLFFGPKATPMKALPSTRDPKTAADLWARTERALGVTWA